MAERNPESVIGYYVHHHGRGHRHRAAAIAQALGGSDHDVVALSSLPRPADGPFADWVRLPPDDRDPAAVDHTAGGALHWAPLSAPGYAERMNAVAAWIASARPSAFVVDTSVEVAALARLLGVPVVAVAGAGIRPDPPHTLLYSLADRIVAPWPAAVMPLPHLRPHASRTTYVGAVSRFDGRPVVPPPGRRRVLLLLGSGGHAVTGADVERARAATPGWTWAVRGLDPSSWEDDVWDALLAADVVVSAAGMNSLAEIAAARRPAVVLPQSRPFDEQTVTAQALAREELATVVHGWPAAPDWPGLLDKTAASDGRRWAIWSTGTGARAAADVIASAVRRS